MREQLEQKAQYMSAHATSNIPAVVRDIKASSSLAAESTKKKATKTTQSVSKDQNPTRKNRKSCTDGSRTRKSRANKGVNKSSLDQDFARLLPSEVVKQQTQLPSKMLPLKVLPTKMLPTKVLLRKLRVGHEMTAYQHRRRPLA